MKFSVATEDVSSVQISCFYSKGLDDLAMFERGSVVVVFGLYVLSLWCALQQLCRMQFGALQDLSLGCGRWMLQQTCSWYFSRVSSHIMMMKADQSPAEFKRTL